MMEKKGSTKQFLCALCGKAYCKKNSLQEHMRLHTDKAPYMCDVCAKSFRYQSTLVRHMKNIHNKDIIRRPVRSLFLSQEEKDLLSNTTKETIENKDEVDKTSKNFECLVCKKGFVCKRSFRRHMDKHFKDKMLQCEYCHARFRTTDHLDNHEKIRILNGICPAPKVLKSFQSDEIEPSNVYRMPKLYKCPICAKIVSNSCHLREHLRRHTGEKPYKCDYCEKTFGHGSAVKRHIRTIHNRIPIPALMKRASIMVKVKEAAVQENLSNGNTAGMNSNTENLAEESDCLLMTSSERPINEEGTKNKIIKCVYCSASFSTNYQLKEHARIHTGEKPFECDFCERKFRHLGTAKRHIALIHKVNPVKVRKGPRQSYIFSKLIKEIAESISSSNKEESPPRKQTYRCDTCELEFLSQGGFSRHMTTVHKKIPSGQEVKSPLNFPGNESVLSKGVPNRMMGGKIFPKGKLHKKHRNRKISGSEDDDFGSISSKSNKADFGDESPYVRMVECSNNNLDYVDKGSSRVPKNGQGELKRKQNKKDLNGETARIYRCSVCKVAFHNPSHIEEHMRKHTGEKPFKCNYCTMTFRHSSAFSRHTRAVHNMRPVSKRRERKTRVFKCTQCFIVYPSQNLLERHMNDHENMTIENRKDGSRESRQGIGSECQGGVDTISLKMSTNAELRQNCEISKNAGNGRDVYKCSVCKVTMSNLCHLEEHMRIHTGEKPFKCKYCTKTYRYRAGYTKHVRIMHKKRPDRIPIVRKTALFKCNLCFMVYPDQILYRKHMNEHENMGIENMKEGSIHNPEKGSRQSSQGIGSECQGGVDTISLKMSTNAEVRQNCEIPKNAGNGRDIYKCSVCKVAMSNLCHLEEHMRIHTGEKPFKCKYCTKTYRYRAGYTKHVRIMHKKRPDRIPIVRKTDIFKCNLCFMVYPDQILYRKHMNEHENMGIENMKEGSIHNPEKGSRQSSQDIGNECQGGVDTISLKMSTNAEVRQNCEISKNAVNGRDVYKCSVCKVAMSNLCHLEEHMRIHTGEKPFQCKYCNKTYRYRAGYTKHVRIMHKKRPDRIPIVRKTDIFKCNPCFMVYPDQILYRKHMNEHENMGIENMKEGSTHNHENSSHESSQGIGRECQGGVDTISLKMSTNAEIRQNFETSKNAGNGRDIYKCSVCKVAMSNLCHLEEHMRIHTGERPFKCKYCTKTYRYRAGYTKHVRIMHKKRPDRIPIVRKTDIFKCNLCFMVYPDQILFRKHMNEHENMGIENMKEGPIHNPEKRSRQSSQGIGSGCQGGVDTISLKMSTNAEVRQNCEISKNAGNGRDVYKCSVCKVAMSKLCHLEEHMRIHTGEKPFKCKYCTKTYRYRAGYTKHVRIMHKKRPDRIPIVRKTALFKCNLCFMVYPDQIHYRKHMNEHENIGVENMKEGSIHNHEKGSRQSSQGIGSECQGGVDTISLKMSTNAEVRQNCEISKNAGKGRTSRDVYKCSVCKVAMSNLCHLEEHMRKHTGEKPFKCDYCQRTFKHSSTCSRHIRVIHNKAPVRRPRGRRPKVFKCNLCFTAYPDQNLFKRHMQQHESLSFGNTKYDSKVSLEKDSPENGSDKGKDSGRLNCVDKICLTTSTFVGVDSKQEIAKIDRKGKTDQIYKCSVCKVPIRNPSHHEEHMRKHTGERPFECDYCQMSFKHSSACSRHIRVMHNKCPVPRPSGRRSKVFKCNLCFTIYPDQNHLEQHMKQHETTRDVSVISLEKDSSENDGGEECGSEYQEIIDTRSLDVSANVNLGLELVTKNDSNVDHKKIWKCSVCSKLFSSNWHLREHMRVHSGERPFKCDDCEMTFRQSSVFKMHVKLKHKKRPSRKARVQDQRKGVFERIQVRLNFPSKKCIEKHVENHQSKADGNVTESSSIIMRIDTSEKESLYFKDGPSENMDVKNVDKDFSEILGPYTGSAEIKGINSSSQVNRGIEVTDRGSLEINENEENWKVDGPVNNPLQNEENEGIEDFGNDSVQIKNVENFNKEFREKENVVDTRKAFLQNKNVDVTHKDFLENENVDDTHKNPAEEVDKDPLDWVQNGDFEKGSLLHDEAVDNNRGSSECRDVKDAVNSFLECKDGFLENKNFENCLKVSSVEVDIDSLDNVNDDISDRGSLLHMDADNNTKGSIECQDMEDTVHVISEDNNLDGTDEGSLQNGTDEEGLKYKLRKTSNSSKTVRVYECNLCNAKVYNSSHFQEHMILHTGEKPFNREYCEMTFRQRSSFFRHVKMIHKERPERKARQQNSYFECKNDESKTDKKYKCPFCSKRVTQRHHLEEHMRMHTGERPFECKFCKQRFRQSSSLMRHLRLHQRYHVHKRTPKRLGDEIEINSSDDKFIDSNYQEIGGENNEKDDDGDDDNATNDNESLKHQKNSCDSAGSNKKRIPCTYCSKVFSSVAILEEHMSIHTGKEQFSCDICERTFSQYSTYSKHMKLLHKKSPLHGSHVTNTDRGLAMKLDEDVVDSDEYVAANDDDDSFELEHPKIEVDNTQKDTGSISNGNCMFCGVGFSSPSDMEEHVRIHTKERRSHVNGTDKFKTVKLYTSTRGRDQIVAANGDKAVANGEDLYVLLESTKMDKIKGAEIFQCKLCSKTTSLLSHMKEHIRTHTGEKPFRCDICDGAFRQSSGLLKHMKLVHKQKPPRRPPIHDSTIRRAGLLFKCVFCFKTFQSNVRLQEHMRIHAGEKPLQYPDCGKAFQLSGGLLTHLKEGCEGASIGDEIVDNCEDIKLRMEAVISEALRDREEESKLGKNSIKLPCIECGKVFDKIYRLKEHMLVHTREKPFQCFFCEQSFRFTSIRLRHMKKYHADCPIPKRKKLPRRQLSLLCYVCGKIFSSRNSLKQHMRIHSKVKPFECEFCSRRFRYQASLHAHLKTRKSRGECPTKKKCGERNAEDKAPKLFQCEFCSKTVTQVHHLREHMRVHTGEKPYSCHDCGKAFRHTNSFYRHMAKVHQVHVDRKRGRKILGFNNSKFSIEGTSRISLREKLKQENKIDSNSICSNTISQEHLQEHTALNAGETLHRCDFCNMLFSTAGSLFRHTIIAHDQENAAVGENKYLLNNNSQLSDDPAVNLQRLHHNKSNTRSREPANCAVCGKTFTTKGHLQVHMRIHTGVLPFECHFCHKRYRYKCNLNRHLKYRQQHGICPMTNERRGYKYETATQGKSNQSFNFKCSICDKTYTRFHSLKVHMRRHTGEKSYHCDICATAFARSGNLYRHKRTVHKISPPLKSLKNPTPSNDPAKPMAAMNAAMLNLDTANGKDSVNYSHPSTVSYETECVNEITSLAKPNDSFVFSDGPVNPNLPETIVSDASRPCNVVSCSSSGDNFVVTSSRPVVTTSGLENNFVFTLSGPENNFDVTPSRPENNFVVASSMPENNNFVTSCGSDNNFAVTPSRLENNFVATPSRSENNFVITPSRSANNFVVTPSGMNSNFIVAPSRTDRIVVRPDNIVVTPSVTDSNFIVAPNNRSDNFVVRPDNIVVAPSGMNSNFIVTSNRLDSNVVRPDNVVTPVSRRPDDIVVTESGNVRMDILILQNMCHAPN